MGVGNTGNGAGHAAANDAAAGATQAPASGQASLIEYPCRFPIKVMGLHAPGFSGAMALIAKNFDPDFDEALIEHRPSSAGKYLGLTLSVTVISREQLDELYRTLSTHPMVKIVL